MSTNINAVAIANEVNAYVSTSGMNTEKVNSLITNNTTVTTHSAEIASLKTSKVGYAEVVDGILNLHDTSSKTTLIKSIVLPSGGSGGGLSEAQVRAIITGYGYSTFSGSYNDLTNKPTLFSGSYNDLTNKPTIPTVSNDFTNDYKTKVDTLYADYLSASEVVG